MKKNFSIIMICILLFSCKLVDENIKPNDNRNDNHTTGLENIKFNFNKNKIDVFEAYILTKKYINRQENNSENIKNGQEFINEIISQLKDLAKKEYDEKNYESALRYILSLKHLNETAEVSINEVFKQQLKHIEASDDIFSLNDLKEEMADLKLLTNKEIFDLLKYYYEHNSRGVFLYDIDKYNKIYPTLLNEFPELNSYKEKIVNIKDLNIEELMKSVVTVILDKGINIKGGVSFFDKTIGTGFFIDDNGYILTNHHVIADHVDPKYEGYSKVLVSTKDSPDKEIPAQVIGYDKVFDIALLKIPVKNKNYLVLGRSNDMTIGDKIYTIGNPLGIKYTVTTGIISNKDLDFFQLGKGFMIDAAINPGNSGGPLIDENGQVVGIVFAGIPQFANINFAIPFQWVRKTIPALYKGGEVKRCWIGGALYRKDDKIFFYYILPDGPLSKADIKVGDQLLSINGVNIKSIEDAQSILAWMRYPQLIEIETDHEGKIIKNIIRLEERPYLPVETAFLRDTEGNLITLIFGFSIDYYNKSLFFKKYKIIKIYKELYASQMNIGEDDPITVYELKYLEKQKTVRLTIRYKQKDFAIIDRIITIESPVEINSII